MHDRRSTKLLAGALGALTLTACAHGAAPGTATAGTGRAVTETDGTTAGQATGPATPEAARAFVARVDRELKKLYSRAETAEYIKSTYITVDTERNAAWANEDLMAYLTRAIAESRRFDGLDLDPDTARQIHLLRLAGTLPAPSDPERRAELAEIAARLEGIYGKGRWCGPSGEGPCKDLGELSETLATSRDYDALLDAWVGWRTVSPPMRDLYARQVELANEGARELGYADLSERWLAGYDMEGEAFRARMDALWDQLAPLYEQLHCHVRAKLAEVYGDKVPADGPIPAHLLGNMWAQEWTNLYPMLVPYPEAAGLDVSGALKAKGWSPERMVQASEAFFTSLGFDALPDTFWERSMFTRPRDRDVVCHASAWDNTYDGDVRIKMCIRPTDEDLVTIHHELGHVYYYEVYNRLPVLYQRGANDGFHEAIGDTIVLSVTPDYLAGLGLLEAAPDDPQGVVNVQMKEALGAIAFLPFGKLMDEWRWDVFSGRIPPERYNEAWWELRRRYQGIAPPVERTEADFDPGAKYHIPGNTPYLRYYIARILQYQFHQALCEAAGHEGPLHTCSIHGSKAAGAKLKAMLALGQSRPWPEALEVLTGQREMDASAILAYFEPLRSWLETQNEGRTCGW